MTLRRVIPGVVALVVFFSVWNSAWGSNSIQVSIEDEKIPLSHDLVFLEDPLGELGVQDILLPENAEKFQPIIDQVPSFGLSTSAYWVGFVLESTESTTLERYLELDFPILREVDLFIELEDGTFRQYSTGYGKKFSERPILTRTFVFPIELKPSVSTKCFLRIRSLSALQAPLTIWSPAIYRQVENGRLIYFGLLYGGLLLFLLCNLVLLLWTRDRVYTYFFFGLSCLLLYLASYRGFAGVYLWTDNLLVREMAIPTILPFLSGFSLLCTVEFLRVENLFPRVARCTRYLGWGIMLTVIPHWLWGSVTRSTLLPLCSVVGCVIVIALTLLMYRVKEWSSRVYCLAWTVVGLAAISFAFEKLGWLGRSQLTEFGLSGSMVILVLLLNIALALRLQEILDSKRMADAEASKHAVETALASEKIELEVKMLTQSKLATLGELAGAMAHEITQPLSYITGALELVLRRSKDGTLNFKKEAYRLEVMHRQANRIGLIVNHLQTFGTEDFESSDNPVLVQELVENTLVLFRERFNKSGVECRVRFHQDNIRVRGNAHQLEQVLINLVQNAHQALIEEKSDNPRIEIEARQGLGGRTAMIAIKDNGAGIPPDVLDRIFEPFFTTKEVGKGTGLGLSIVYGIIQSHHGTIDYSAPGYKGGFGEMRIELPRYSEDIESPA